MNDFIKTIDGLPKVVKIIFALPFLDILWAIYRIIKAVVKKNTTNLIVGIIWILLGWGILWVVDLICIIMKDRIPFTAD